MALPDTETSSYQLLQRSLNILTEDKIISMLKGEITLPDGKTLTVTQMSGIITIISLCDDSMTMGFPRVVYSKLFTALTEIAIPTLQDLEVISTLDELDKYITSRFKGDAPNILTDIAKFSTPAWKDDFKLESTSIQIIESLPHYCLLIGKIIVLIRVLAAKCMIWLMIFLLEQAVKLSPLTRKLIHKYYII